MKVIECMVLVAAMGVVPALPAATLVENGKATSLIVVGDVGAAGTYAATELADYLRKITGDGPAISSAAIPGKYPVYFCDRMPEAEKSFPADVLAGCRKVKDDGFLLAVRSDATYLYAARARGLVYAAYEILKRFGDCRWFFPGEEGEYCPRRLTFALADGFTTLQNPSIRHRFFNFVCYNRGKAEEAFKWQLRNNMIVMGNPGYPGFDKYAMHYTVGGHVFSTLLPDALFDEDNELFCLVNGRRLPQSGKVDKDGRRIPGSPQANQPCTTNPKTVAIMKENLRKMILKAGRIPDAVNVINNDSQQWCECDRCRALDTHEESLGLSRATRYWTLINDLVADMHSCLPGLNACVLAYQAQQDPPEGPIRPDRSCEVPVAVHQRCYAHAMGDESCAVNARFRRTLGKWQKLGTPTGVYEYTNMLPGEFYNYNPLEETLAADIAYYASVGGAYYIDELAPGGAEYNEKRWGKRILEQHRSNWMNSYVQAKFLWNAKGDLNAILDDAGKKFYGKAWPKFREFRRLLRKLYVGSGTHFMYGTTSRALGKCIADPADEAALLKLLDEAVAAADGDERVLARLGDERKFFEGAWCASAKDFRTNGSRNYPLGRGEKLKITDFRKRSSLEKSDPPVEATVSWDGNFLRFEVTMMTPAPEKLLARRQERDSAVWDDASVELYVAPPDWKGAYLHVIANPIGTVYDKKTYTPGYAVEFESDVRVSNEKGADRWTLKADIPWAKLGIEPKAGLRIPINIGRSLVYDDLNLKAHCASWNSAFHGVEIFNSIELREP